MVRADDEGDRDGDVRDVVGGRHFHREGARDGCVHVEFDLVMFSGFDVEESVVRTILKLDVPNLSAGPEDVDDDGAVGDGEGRVELVGCPRFVQRGPGNPSGICDVDAEADRIEVAVLDAVFNRPVVDGIFRFFRIYRFGNDRFEILDVVDHEDRPGSNETRHDEQSELFLRSGIEQRDVVVAGDEVDERILIQAVVGILQFDRDLRGDVRVDVEFDPVDGTDGHVGDFRVVLDLAGPDGSAGLGRRVGDDAASHDGGADIVRQTPCFGDAFRSPQCPTDRIGCDEGGIGGEIAVIDIAFDFLGRTGDDEVSEFQGTFFTAVGSEGAEVHLHVEGGDVGSLERDFDEVVAGNEIDVRIDVCGSESGILQLDVDAAGVFGIDDKAEQIVDVLDQDAGAFVLELDRPELGSGRFDVKVDALIDVTVRDGRIFRPGKPSRGFDAIPEIEGVGRDFDDFMGDVVFAEVERFDAQRRVVDIGDGSEDVADDQAGIDGFFAFFSVHVLPQLEVGEGEGAGLDEVAVVAEHDLHEEVVIQRDEFDLDQVVAGDEVKRLRLGDGQSVGRAGDVDDKDAGDGRVDVERQFVVGVLDQLRTGFVHVVPLQLDAPVVDSLGQDDDFDAVFDDFTRHQSAGRLIPVIELADIVGVGGGDVVDHRVDGDVGIREEVGEFLVIDDDRAFPKREVREFERSDIHGGLDDAGHDVHVQNGLVGDEDHFIVERAGQDFDDAVGVKAVVVVRGLGDDVDVAVGSGREREGDLVGASRFQRDIREHHRLQAVADAAQIFLDDDQLVAFDAHAARGSEDGGTGFPVMPGVDASVPSGEFRSGPVGSEPNLIVDIVGFDELDRDRRGGNLDVAGFAGHLAVDDDRVGDDAGFGACRHQHAVFVDLAGGIIGLKQDAVRIVDAVRAEGVNAIQQVEQLIRVDFGFFEARVRESGEGDREHRGGDARRRGGDGGRLGRGGALSGRGSAARCRTGSCGRGGGDFRRRDRGRKLIAGDDAEHQKQRRKKQ